jgi:hypothetical protein
MFKNQPKTMAELLLKVRYAGGDNSAVAAIATYGVPNLLHFWKMRGANPSLLSPYSVREEIKTLAEPELNAEVHTKALTIDGSALIPARSNAMTKGDCWAVPVASDKLSSL